MSVSISVLSFPYIEATFLKSVPHPCNFPCSIDRIASVVASLHHYVSVRKETGKATFTRTTTVLLFHFLPTFFPLAHFHLFHPLSLSLDSNHSDAARTCKHIARLNVPSVEAGTYRNEQDK